MGGGGAAFCGCAMSTSTLPSSSTTTFLTLSLVAAEGVDCIALFLTESVLEASGAVIFDGNVLVVAVNCGSSFAAAPSLLDEKSHLLSSPPRHVQNERRQLSRLQLCIVLGSIILTPFLVSKIVDARGGCICDSDAHDICDFDFGMAAVLIMSPSL